MSDEKALALTPEQEAEIEKKMNTPIKDVPITMKLLESIANLPAIPDHYKGKPKEMMAAVLMGREIGIGGMTAINNIDLIDGNVSLRAKLMSALIHQHGHIMIVEEQSTERAAFKCQRYHRQLNQLIDVGVIEYTWEDAEASGKSSQGTYKKHRRAMLSNRALTLAARTVFADALAGFAYTIEELGINDEYEPIPPNLEEAQASVEVLLDAEVITDGGEYGD